MYVRGLVPNYLLPNKMPGFLHPLITEIEDAFIDGYIAVCPVKILLHVKVPLLK